MPTWVSWLFDIGTLATLVGFGVMLYNAGKNRGVLESKVADLEQGQKNQEKYAKEQNQMLEEKIKNNQEEFRQRKPLSECQELFRKISTDIGQINGKLDMLISEVRKGNEH